jgi:AGZA family xanthine/uracil permease-like MFS transporter
MKLFVKRDLDGFCGLFVDNLVQLLMIVVLGGSLCGMDSELLYRVVLPGTAVSVLVGNVFYAWQAHRLARRTGRNDVTALPYGINTPSLLVYIFFVIKPAYDKTGDPLAAWRLGLLACLGSGIIELMGAFIADWIRRNTPRAALLSTLAGIAIGFISMTFALQIFNKPLIAFLPMSLVLVGLFSRVRLPLGLPSGFIAVVTGTGIAWLMVLVHGIPGVPDWLTFGAVSADAVRNAQQLVGFSPPVWCGDAVLQGMKELSEWVPFLSVVLPMGIFNVIGSLQNIESAEAAGDPFPAAPAMAMNGIGTIVAALLGSCFPTTIYIGHPGWKALGARAGYSTLNGVVIVLLAVLGLIGVVATAVPIEAGGAIALWIGIIITAQAFQSTPPEHAPAVAVGLFPAIAAWGATVMLGAFGIAQGQTLQQIISPTAAAVSQADSPENVKPSSAPASPAKPTAEVSGFLVHGLLLMERGYVFTCMILAAVSVCLIERKFMAAAIWMLTAAMFTWLGVMHAYQVYQGFAFDYLFRFVPAVEGAYVYRAADLAIGYLICAAFFFVFGLWAKNRPVSEGH